LDFGAGFYTTSNRKQAENFTLSVALRTNTATRFVSEYAFDDAMALQELDVLKFAAANEQWLDFVVQNRQGKFAGKSHDLILGPVANDDLFPTIQAYESGVFTKEQTLLALKVRELYDQYVFCTDDALSYLVFTKEHQLGGQNW
jgi:hypothetical protein